jgi:3-methyladenine DNA glycosylase/8-oxoguanine DNA glycosylase
MEPTVKVQVDLPESFSKLLDHKLIDMKESGVRKSKAQYIVELAQIAFLQKQVSKS